MLIRPFESNDENPVVELWTICGLVVPRNDPHEAIRKKLKVNPEWFLVGVLDEAIIGTCMVGYEGRRGWINYLAIHPDCRRRGYASAFMHEAERLLREVGCPKINLQVRTRNVAVIDLYRSIGYELDDVVSLGKRLQETEARR